MHPLVEDFLITQFPEINETADSICNNSFHLSSVHADYIISLLTHDSEKDNISYSQLSQVLTWQRSILSVVETGTTPS